MKISFEIGRSKEKPVAITGRDLRSPLNVPDGVMKPEYMAAYRSIEEQAADWNKRQSRAYDAGITTNYNMDLRGTYGAPNTEIFPFKYKTRANARSLEKDTPHGKAVIRTFGDNVVGDDPFELEMGLKKADGKTDDDEVNDGIEEAWNKYCWSENFTIAGNMSAAEAWRIIEMENACVGNTIMKLHPGFEYNEFGFAVELQEEDRLQETYVGVSGEDSMFGPGNPIRASIEYHPKYITRPIAYWILTRHPGEAYAMTAAGYPKTYREQWPASKIILWQNLKTRAEQDLGMTELDATTQPLWRNYQYDKALVIAAMNACVKAFVIEKKLPTGMQLPVELANDPEAQRVWLGNGLAGTGAVNSGAAVRQNGAATPATVLRPGQERQLEWGQEAKILDPQFPVEAAHEFRQDNLRDIAAGSGTTYQHISGDYQNLGFIAGLMCQQPFQRYMRIRQNHFIENLRKLFREWLRNAILKGYFDRKGVDVEMSRLEEYVEAAKFKGQQWEFVNPLVQAQALIILCEAGHISRQQVQDMLPRGLRLKKLVAALENEAKMLEDAGLQYDDSDVTRPTISKGEPGQTVPQAGEGGEQAPAKQRPANPVRRAKVARELLEMATRMSLNGEH